MGTVIPIHLESITLESAYFMLFQVSNKKSVILLHSKNSLFLTDLLSSLF